MIKSQSQDAELNWVKPSVSGANGDCPQWVSYSNGNCPEWSKSPFSFSNGACAEHTSATLDEARAAGVPKENLEHPKIQDALGRGERLILLRTSTNPGVALAYTISEWLAFVLAMLNGEAHLLTPEETLIALDQLQLPAEKLAHVRDLLGLEPVAA